MQLDWSAPDGQMRIRSDLPIRCIRAARASHTRRQSRQAVRGEPTRWVIPKSIVHALAATAGRLAALAHPQRLAILTELLTGAVGHARLAAVTGLKPGPLYFHLAELRTAGLIGPKERDQHRLTPSGQRAVLATLAISRLLK